MSLYLRWFTELGSADVPQVGGKNASLGELVRALSAEGIAVPGGFAITADGYRHFVAQAGLGPVLELALAGLDPRNVEDLRRRGERIRRAFLTAEVPADLAAEITSAYATLAPAGADPAAVAVRSSATAEDLPDASFAGQQESFLNVRGPHAVLNACRRCYASLFKDRAISYRADKGFDPLSVALSVGIQRMVRSDLASSGVIFTLDPESGFRDVVVISAAYGLGETVVQGTVDPDEYCVFKPTLRAGFRPIVRRRVGKKELKLVYDAGGTRRVRPVPVPEDERVRCVLADDEILQLARWACRVEEHYSAQRGQPMPMDLEWAKDGLSGELFIVQARPETVQARRDPNLLETYRLRERSRVIVTGASVGERIAAGPVRVIPDTRSIGLFRPGEVLVTEKTDPDWEPIMKVAAAVVTDRGGRTCHAAIVSRELGVPALVGTGRGTALLHDGQLVTVSCAEGETGRVYEGALGFDIERTSLRDLARPATRLMLNIGDPAEAFALSLLPSAGVGLAREEFIISSSIQVHPLALLDFERMEDGEVKRQIAALTAGQVDKAQFFVDRLAEGAGLIAAAFHPREVILRLSDFKTNEYANLIGGRAYEPVEANPMIGFRGASRYYHPRYQDGFALECRAVRKVREEMGLANLKVMIPFCRTVEEGRRVERELARHGLTRGVNGLEVYMMCEVPSNVILAEEFTEIFDGFSIGSNDLTQLILGVDRDSEIIAPLFDERNPAVLRMITRVIEACRARGRKIGICGQAPSDYPDFAAFLVRAGIDSISLNADTLLRTTRLVLEQEARCRAERESHESHPIPNPVRD
jgi:pyruvate,water dikinase